jgi:hypothetical protein
MPSVRPIVHQGNLRQDEARIAEFLSLGASSFPIDDEGHSSSSSDHERQLGWMGRSTPTPRDPVGEDRDTPMSITQPSVGEALSLAIGVQDRPGLHGGAFDRLLRRWAAKDMLPGLSGAFGSVLSPRLHMIYKPYDGQTYAVPKTPGEWRTWLKREEETNRISMDERRQEKCIVNEVAILVTSATDIELLANHPFRVKCMDPCRLGFRGRNVYDYSKRLSLVSWIPELALVVVASQVGRVMLLSLVKPHLKHVKEKRHLCFCVEKVLPSEEEERERLRPDCPLFGIAVGPLQEAIREDDLRLKDGGRRRRGSGETYRLLLHYRDHSILSYQIRRPAGRELEVF